ncbi:hypothetical protein [Colwellia hornerae]|uniref:Uncharacterized protein n=1 Tax=Colwellia hornerae TaxID=89402 RepID=A0A5C6Q2I2_9GAMM|nr:hypothetical protein [Colwellia hornerae]TWX46355.1 hypothetical protein ESZ28_18300 [Colwellia hornerae]TWX53920.1 hypothetical protein ESZ26_18275 [Colwellia hornerae]TWX63043.1 hypothetical protein ESZ27_18135 [Colwellia hornerae]
MEIYDPRYYGELTTSTFSSEGGFVGINIEPSGTSKHAYPIKIAWYGNIREGSLLIKPVDIWLSEGFWCNYSEKHGHGITKKLLENEGLDVESSALKLNKILANKIVVCDVVEYEGIWLTQLYEKADITPSFRMIGHLALNDYKKRIGNTLF